MRGRVNAIRTFKGLVADLRVNISRKALMEKCRIYATAYNPFIYVKDKQLKGTDPETNGSDAFPTFRQFVFGVNLTF